MKDFYICDCARHENKVITSTFVVVAKQIKPKKTGEPYLALTLGDRSGQLEAKMWDNVEEVLEAFEQDDFLKVKGLINKYKQRFQLTIHKLRKLGNSEIEFDDYLPKTTKDIDELWQTLSNFVAGFQNPHLKALVQAFMADPEISKAYRCAPAAKTLHHAYIGGLLDHVVSLFRSCDLMSKNYPQVNRDLLLTGVFLHDIGKIHELTYNRSFSYTTKGQLLGHMYEAHGVGLAAPQIGIGRRIAVIDVTFKEDPKAKLVLINPEIIHTEGKHTQSEGCLSIPEFRENVTRPNKVTVRAQDVNGNVFEKTGEELLARAFLHETDHLNGKLYISHISALKRDLMKRKIKKLMKAGEW